MKNNHTSITLSLSCMILSSLSTQTFAENTNPFQFKELPQGYMLLAENSPQDASAPSDNVISSEATHAQAQSQSTPKPPTKAVSEVKPSKSVYGGCDQGWCSAKLKKAQRKKIAK